MKRRVFLLIALASCQTKPTKVPLEINDLVGVYKKLPAATQKESLGSNWAFFGNAFDFDSFQKRLLENFPSLDVFGKKDVILGSTGLDLRLLKKVEANPVAVLLAIDLEMELLSRYHTQSNENPRCLESFWSEWGLKIPVASAEPSVGAGRITAQASTIDTANEVPLNETSKRLALYLRQSLGLPADTKMKALALESDTRARFAIGEEVYEIFSSPIECKVLQEKKYLIPALGKLKCIQKQSAAWITVLARESTFLGDDWIPEARKRCQRWVRPLSSELRKDFGPKLQASPLPKSWSLYPRLRTWILREADRYEAAFRECLKAG